MDEVTLPTGEKLPGYEDEPQVDAHVINAWLVEHCPQRWGKGSVPNLNDAHSLQPEQVAMLGEYERTIITDVIGALLAVGQATIVKNETYRSLERDRQAVERLAAGLARLGLNGQVIEADGDPARAAIQSLEGLLRVVQETTR